MLTVIAAPLVIVCCGGGVALTAITGAAGGSFGGVGGLAVALIAAVAALIWRGQWRTWAVCCEMSVPLKGSRKP